MLMVFHLGTFLVQKAIMSVMILMEGRGGKIHSFWAMYSLRMSFWIVPPIRAGLTPCFSAVTMYMARRTAAGLLMVMEVATVLRGMPLNRVSMSLRESTATPHFPTSPLARGW